MGQVSVALVAWALSTATVSAFGQATPFPSPPAIATAGAINIGVVDLDSSDGIAASAFVEGLPSTTRLEVQLVRRLNPVEAIPSVFESQFVPNGDPVQIEAHTSALDRPLQLDSIFAQNNVWLESYSLTLTPHTRLLISMEATAVPRPKVGSTSLGDARVSLSLDLGGRSFSDTVTDGSDQFQFTFTSGADEVTGTLRRSLVASAGWSFLPAAPIPEPQTYALLAAGLLALAAFRRSSRA